MLINTISFEIHDFENNTSEEFLIPDTLENYEMVAGHKFTRNIHFTKTFDFQYAKEMRAPEYMKGILFLEYLSKFIEEFELDDIDEMVGTCI